MKDFFIAILTVLVFVYVPVIALAYFAKEGAGVEHGDGDRVPQPDYAG